MDPNEGDEPELLAERGPGARVTDESKIRGMMQGVYDDIVTMLQQGFSPQEVSEEAGWSIGTIYKIQRAEGIHGRHLAAIEHVDQDAFLQDYRGGMRVVEVMTKYNLHSLAFYKLLTILGEPTRRRDPLNLEARKRQLDEAIAMYEQGFLIYEIESETGVAQPTLHKELHARGIPLRRPRDR